ncbi:hypothetical protein BGZ94_010187 [Podila epigama]|nr:hypothetical protein BGZ94_010187 [Podila epigama]
MSFNANTKLYNSHAPWASQSEVTIVPEQNITTTTLTINIDHHYHHEDGLAVKEKMSKGVLYQDQESSTPSPVDSTNGLLVRAIEEDMSPSMQKRLIRKIDWNVLPLLTILYLFVFLGRNNIGNAKIIGLVQDLNLSSSEYNWAVSIIFFGSSSFVIPSNIVLKRFGPRIWIFVIMMVWCIVMVSMATVKSGPGLLACRFFLGVAECGLLPGAIFMISVWYTKSQIAFRNGLFFGAGALSGAFGGLLAFGLEHMDGILGLHGWQWIFIMDAVPVLVTTLAVVFFLPNFPEEARFLTKDELAMVRHQLNVDAGPATQTEFSWPQVWLAFRDWKIYVHGFAFLLVVTPLHSMAAFAPSILREFKASPLVAELLTIPIFVIAFLCTIAMAISSDRFKERGFHFAGPMFVSALGYVYLILSRDASVHVRYVGLIIATLGTFSSLPAMMAWFSTNIGGHTKRAAGTAIIVLIGNLGGVIGGQIYDEKDAVHGYIRGHTICAIVCLAACLLILMHKTALSRENQRRERLSPEQFLEESRGENLCDAHPTFRYWT